MNKTPCPEFGQPLDLVHQLSLIAEVEAGGRLVQDNELRILRERTGEENELPLTARDHRVGPFGQVRDSEALECIRCGRTVAFARTAEQVAVRGPAHEHHTLDRKRKGRRVRLGHVSDRTGALAR